MAQFDVEPSEAHQAEVPGAVTAFLFIVVMAIFVTGLWAMGEGVALHNGWIFSAGLLGSCGAVMVAIHARRD